MGCYYSSLVCQTSCRCWESHALLYDSRPQHFCHCYSLSSVSVRCDEYWLDTHGTFYFWNGKFLLISRPNLLLIHLRPSLQIPTYPVTVSPWYLHRKYSSSVIWTFPPEVIKTTELCNISQMTVRAVFIVEKIISHMHTTNTSIFFHPSYASSSCVFIS